MNASVRGSTEQLGDFINLTCFTMRNFGQGFWFYMVTLTNYM